MKIISTKFFFIFIRYQNLEIQIFLSCIISVKPNLNQIRTNMSSFFQFIQKNRIYKIFSFKKAMFKIENALIFI